MKYGPFLALIRGGEGRRGGGGGGGRRQGRGRGGGLVLENEHGVKFILQ